MKIKELEGYDGTYKNLAYAHYHNFIDIGLSHDDAILKTHRAIVKSTSEILKERTKK